MTSSFERNYHARQINNFRKILRGNEPLILPPALEESEKTLFSAGMMGMCFILAGFMFIASCVHSTPAHAEESINGYKISQYVQAIYYAEGGSKAKYSFGIHSVHYSSFAEAREICKRTVLYRYHIFTRYAHRNYPRFIDYLQASYCPTQSRNLSPREIRLNQYWVKNVAYFLRKDA